VREGADARLARLLAIVPWVAAQDGPTVAEVSARFGVTEKDLVADLELLFLCGVYPFTPDVLIDVHFADGRVWISMADWFRRPLRFNPHEALALVSAGRTLLNFPDTESAVPLRSALDKLDRALGIDSGDTLEVGLARVDADTLSKLRRSAGRREKVRIRYYSFGRDETTERVVHPWQVFNSSGEWYLRAWCEVASAERNFRLDRIQGLEPAGGHFEEGPVADSTPSVFNPAPEDPLWTLDLQPGAHWIAEQYPNESVEPLPGGVLRVRLRAHAGAWLERLLLRAGPHVSVVEGEPGLGAAAAGRLLRRYRDDSIGGVP
jgi:proteasome accessory factor C